MTTPESRDTPLLYILYEIVGDLANN